MAERTNKRLRRMSTEDSEGADDWTPEDAYAGGNTIRVGGRPRGDTNESAGTSRSRRVVASKQRSLSPAQGTSGKRTLRLTVKAPPNRLRQVAAGSTRGSLARNSKNKAPILDFSEEEDEGEDELEDNDGEGDEEEDGEDEDELAEEDENEEEEEDEEEEDEDEPEDPEDEEEDADGDVDMEDAPTTQAPKIKISAPSATKPSPAQVLKSHGAKIKSVEEQEMEDGSGEDEELSDLGSDEEEGDEDEEDEEDEDGEGADEDNDIIAANNVDGTDDLDSEMDESTYDSRAGTPDLTKLTRRQRSQYQEDGDGLMALSNEAQKKKFFTAEQITMRRAEMARRRKDLSEKRNEEEKADTLQRLLHKPTHKRRSRLQQQQAVDDDAVATPGSQEIEIIKPSAIYVRSISNKDGTTLGVPEEWIGTPVGQLFSGNMAPAQPVTRDSWGLSTFIEVIEETSTPEVSGQA